MCRALDLIFIFIYLDGQPFCDFDLIYLINFIIAVEYIVIYYM